ncbi:27399_t:CDS:2, partial [Racocetra persica]
VENTKERVVKASDEKESSKNEKKENVSGLYSIGHCGEEKKEIKRDENKILTCYQNTSNMDKDEKQMLEQNSEYVEGGESVIEPKVEDENRLVFDRGKLIKSEAPISDIHCGESDAEIADDVESCGQTDIEYSYQKGSNSSNANNEERETYDDVIKKGDENLRDKIGIRGADVVSNKGESVNLGEKDVELVGSIAPKDIAIIYCDDESISIDSGNNHNMSIAK